jgi:hypothetical protein
MSFFPRFITSTSTDFPEGELSLLNKSIIYNLSYKPNEWTRILALQVETANFSLPKADQEHSRWEFIININSLYQNHSQCLNYNALNENKLLIQIKNNMGVPNLKFPEHTK